jgi:Rrf2 family transcriptional regulator, iron-sulfur cluster assembly transcription factor
MQFTRKGDYALKAMAYLAEVKGIGPHTIDEISEKSNVPRHFLAKILKELTRANLLIAVKGARGGYTLARRPAEISLLEVIEASVGPLALNICLEGSGRCAELSTCGLYPVWKQASHAVRDVFGKATLSSISQGR